MQDTTRTNTVNSKHPSQLSFKLLKKFLNNIIIGRLTLNDSGMECHFGDASSTLTATITINNPLAYRKMLLGGSVGTAKAYIDGLWDCDNLANLFLIFLKNYRTLNQIEGGFGHVLNAVNRLLDLFKQNTVSQSKQNIRAHYDLSNEFYQLFLDDKMMYSSGYFKSPDMTLEQASDAKLERICQQLQLNENDHVLEIGTGWGGFAIYAITNYGCRITTTTISDAQYKLAKQRIKDAGVSDKVTLLQRDYRDLEGSYDKLVSIEMVEAVGDKFFGAYFKQCSDLLKPGGLFMLQGITIVDQLYDEYKRSVDFIKKYIFPGGCVPSLAVIMQHIAKQTTLQVLDIHSLGDDYVKTLALWHERFEAVLPQVKQLGFDEAFIRMWRYYLLYCQAGFMQRHINDLQILFHKAEHYG